jgi:hypothetical protein
LRNRLAHGYSKDTVLEWIYRYARQARLVDGASEVRKMVQQDKDDSTVFTPSTRTSPVVNPSVMSFWFVAKNCA